MNKWVGVKMKESQLERKWKGSLIIKSCALGVSRVPNHKTIIFGKCAEIFKNVREPICLLSIMPQ